MAPATPTKGEAKPSNGDAEFMILVLQSFESEPKVDYEKLARLSGMASKASATTKWYKMRQKYMPCAITPKKRKGDTDSDAAAGDSDAKPKVKTPRKTKAKTPKKAEPEEDGDEGEDKEAVKKEASAAKTEEED